MKIRESINKFSEEIKKNRRALHQIPEIGLDTVKTAAYLKQKGMEYGVDLIDDSLLKNSVIMQINAYHETKQSVGLRSDMDALPLLEMSGVEFVSLHEGCMHACGHDGHMATMLATIQYCCEHRSELKQNIIFVFQPGEEGPGGAELMIKNGLFKKYKIDKMIGMHVMSDQPSGTIGCCSGPLMARNGEFQFNILGKSAHGATPQDGRDAIVAASSLILNLQSIVARNVDPIETGVITVGVIHGGQARNVIADRVEVLGTMRAFDDSIYELMKKRMNEVAKGIESMFDCIVEVEIIDYYGVVNNDASLVKMLEEVAQEDYIQVKPRMISEDFSFYQQEVPGIFYFCGVGDAQHTRLIHDTAFNFNEEALLNGVEVNISMLEKLGVLC